MTNVFERARAIRMNGEPWQNAVQRAGSQIRYENQVGGRKVRSDKGTTRGKRSTPTKTLKTGRKVAHRNDAAENCLWHGETGRCHVSAQGKRNSPGKRSPRNLSPAAQAQRAAFTRAAQSVAKGKGTAQKRRDAIKAATRGQKFGTAAASPRRASARSVNLYGQNGGAWDGYSNTSSTRSSDFTSVSDTTSYSQSGGSWTSRDSSSLW